MSESDAIAYRAFAGRVLETLFDFCDLDGLDQQEIALATGMIEPTIFTEADFKEGSGPEGCEPGDEGFRFTARGKVAIAEHQRILDEALAKKDGRAC